MRNVHQGLERNLRCLEAILVGHDGHDLLERLPFIKVEGSNRVLERFPGLGRDLFP